MFYKVIWLLLQTCFSIYQHIRRIFQQLQKIIKSYDRRRDINDDYTHIPTDCEYAFLGQCRTQLSKIPHHISVIIGPDEQIGEEVITRIFRYALRMNIDCISFYDTRLSEEHRIRLNKLCQPKDIVFKQLDDRHFLWRTHTATSISDIPNGKPSDTGLNGFTNTNGLSRTNGHKNGFKEGKSIEIYEIESSNGHGLIANVCRELFTLRKSDEVQKLLENQTLLTQRIDRELSRYLWKDTDPELCIVFAKHMCTFGMLPWHTRFTEFYLHQQEDLFNAKTFAKILFQYSRSEQRWGK